MDTISWDEMLDDFEDLIEQVQHSIDLGEWDGREFPALNMVVPAGDPSEEHQDRLRELLAETAGMEQHVRDLQGDIRVELERSRLETRASRAYLGTTP